MGSAHRRTALVGLAAGVGFTVVAVACDLSDRERRDFSAAGDNEGPSVGAAIGQNDPTGSGGNGGVGGLGGAGGDGGAGGVLSTCDQSGACSTCLQCTYFSLCSELQIDCNNDLDCLQSLNCMRNCGLSCGYEGVCYQTCRQQNCSLLPGFAFAQTTLDCICRDGCASDCSVDRQADCTRLLP